MREHRSLYIQSIPTHASLGILVYGIIFASFMALWNGMCVSQNNKQYNSNMLYFKNTFISQKEETQFPLKCAGGQETRIEDIEILIYIVAYININYKYIRHQIITSIYKQAKSKQMFTNNMQNGTH